MKKRWTVICLCSLLFFITAMPAVWAGKAEWTDGAYNFDSPRFILVMEPRFSYEGFDISGKNKFSNYPYAAEKIKDMLSQSLSGLGRHRFVDMDYVLKQIQADATRVEPYDPKAAEFAGMVQRETAKHVQLVLYLEIKDYGWFYEYHDAYTTTRTVTERISYNRKNSDGSESSGWMDVPRTVVENHPAGYYISDSAGLELRLFDTARGKDVWKYSDSRVRRSPALSNGYDPSGPESMMKRIFEDAFKKMPLAH